MRAADGPRKGFNPPHRCSSITFCSSPQPRTTGGMKGLAPFRRKEGVSCPTNPRVCVRSLSLPDAPTSTGFASRPSAGSTSCERRTRRPTRRRAVRAREAVWLFELAGAQGARRLADGGGSAVRRGAKGRRRQRWPRCSTSIRTSCTRARSRTSGRCCTSRRTRDTWRRWTCC